MPRAPVERGAHDDAEEGVVLVHRRRDRIAFEFGSQEDDDGFVGGRRDQACSLCVHVHQVTSARAPDLERQGGPGREEESRSKLVAYGSPEPEQLEPSAARPDELATASKDRRYWAWADLMRRAFEIDVLACPRCGGRMQLIATIEDPSVIRKILAHLGLPTEVPQPRPPPALGEGWLL